MRIAPLFAGLCCAAEMAASDPVHVSAQSRLVMVPVTVTDRNGKSLTDLSAGQFRVFDNSEPRPVLSVAREEAPVSLGIVFDLSGSMREKLSHAVAAVNAIMAAAQPEDEAFLITFADRPEVRSEPTRNFESIANQLRRAAAVGNTALFDAVYLALDKLKGRGTRRALIVISDGEDNQSRYRQSELMARAVESDVQIYTIGIFEEALSGAFFLEKLAEITGGIAFTVRYRTELPDVAEKMARAMKNLYVISYRPPADSNPGQWRRIRVSIDMPSDLPVRVSARTGYYCPE